MIWGDRPILAWLAKYVHTEQSWINPSTSSWIIESEGIALLAMAPPANL